MQPDIHSETKVASRAVMLLHHQELVISETSVLPITALSVVMQSDHAHQNRHR